MAKFMGLLIVGMLLVVSVGAVGESFPLKAGQNITVGTIDVSNDADNLYVTYATTGDWYVTAASLYVLDDPAGSRLQPGKAPYKVVGISTQSYTFEVPLGDLDGTIYLQPYAEVYSETYGSEGSYGGEITTSGKGQGAWYGEISYEIDPPVYEYVLHVATVNGSSNYRHTFYITYDDGTLSGHGVNHYHSNTNETLSQFHFTVDGTGTLTYIDFRADYDINSYAWYPAFYLASGGGLTFHNLSGDNVSGATGTWEVSEL
jgi:hypothetical protein